MFEKIEIILGFERVLGGLHDILAYQQVTLEELQSVFNRKEKELLERIDEESLKLYLLKDKISHKKMYMLRGEGLPPRVITGSANLSNVAFSGEQLENIYVLNGEKAYNEFFREFNNLKQESTCSISREAILLDVDDNIENIPLLLKLRLAIFSLYPLKTT